MLKFIFVKGDTWVNVPLIYAPPVTDVPLEPEVPDDPDDPDVPEEPEDPDVPEEPLEPDVPEEPELPEVPLEPELPEVPLDPDEPEVPEDPGVPLSASKNVHNCPDDGADPVIFTLTHVNNLYPLTVESIAVNSNTATLDEVEASLIVRSAGSEMASNKLTIDCVPDGNNIC